MNPLNKSSSIFAIQSIEGRIANDIRKLKKINIDFDVFFNYLFTDCCGCLDKECNIEELSKTELKKIMGNLNIAVNTEVKTEVNTEVNTEVKTDVICNTIRVDIGDILKRIYSNIDNPSYSKIALVVKFRELFEKSGLIVKNQNIYFLLNSNMRFKWNNIKMLTVEDIKKFKNQREDTIDKLKKKYVEELTEDEELLMIKSVFWYFRKVVVDSIVSDIIRFNDLDVKAMSVGSTKLTSDYDITLDGTYKKNSRIIRRFDRLMEILFMDDSESVFDTNIYGVSFIKGKDTNVKTPDNENDNNMNILVNQAFKTDHKCGKNTSSEFNYILSMETDFIISQHIWALVKLLLRLSKIQEQDEELYRVCLDELSRKLGNNLYFSSAKAFINKYESNVNNYEKTVDYGSSFLKNVTEEEDSKYLVSNFISYVNYNGSETYLTNGAFLDVVVNNQMCQKENIVKLDFNSYLDSFIENLSDLITHYHKEKYRNRAVNALDKMLETKGFDTKVSQELGGNLFATIGRKNMKLGEYIKGILENIKTIQTKCSEKILECQSFIMIHYILHCIILVFKRYTEWSNISNEKLTKGVERFERLDFKNFKVPIESQISEESLNIET